MKSRSAGSPQTQVSLQPPPTPASFSDTPGLVGPDVHRDFCEVAVADGGRACSAGRVVTSVKDLELFAASLAGDDRVVLEATGNALAIARLIEPHVGEVVLANARQLKATSHARVKTTTLGVGIASLSAAIAARVETGVKSRAGLRGLVPDTDGATSAAGGVRLGTAPHGPSAHTMSTPPPS